MNKIWIICLLLAGSGCVNQEKIQIIQLMGKQISIDESYQSISVRNEEADSLSALYEFEKPIKIITYMDSSACTQCAMQILITWNKILNEVLSDSVGFITVVAPTDPIKIKLALSALKLENSLLYDTNDIFLKDNKLTNILARNRTFLLDAQNHIVLVGEPLSNSQLWELYKNRIQTLIHYKGKIP